jgi:sec-independent protein translocase protein TatA
LLGVGGGVNNSPREEDERKMAVGPWQILVVVILLLVLFGASRLSEIGKGLGEGIKNFKKGLSGDSEENQLADTEPKADAAERPKQLPAKDDEGSTSADSDSSDSS